MELGIKTIQDFWRRWSNEYLTSLNHQQKSRKPHRNVQIGDLVLIKDEKIFHRQWPLARVIKVFPGEDGRVRVADVKTQRGIYRRTTNKLVVLHTQEEAISQDAPSGGKYGRTPPFRYFGLTCSDVTSSVIVGLHLVQSSN